MLNKDFFTAKFKADSNETSYGIDIAINCL